MIEQPPKSFGDQPIYSQNQVTLLTVVKKQDEMLSELKELHNLLTDPRAGVFIKIANVERDIKEIQDWQKTDFAEWRQYVDKRFWVMVAVVAITIFGSILNLIVGILNGL